MKQYLQDKTLFILSLIQTSIGLLTVVYSLLKIDPSKPTIVTRYRPSLGLSGAFVQGPAIDLYAFTLLAVIIAAGSVYVAYRVHSLQREYSLMAIILGIVLALFNARVMYAVLGIK